MHVAKSKVESCIVHSCVASHRSCNLQFSNLSKNLQIFLPFLPISHFIGNSVTGQTKNLFIS